MYRTLTWTVTALLGALLLALVFTIGYFSLRQPAIFAGQAAAIDATGPEDVADETAVPVIAGRSKYEKTRLNEDTAQKHLDALLIHMESARPFLRSSLTLQELADELSIASHHLSQVINDRLDRNFFDFVNGYRVQDVQEKLRDPQTQHLTLLAIAYDSGFSSKSSFNTVFKKHTRMTPSQFRLKGTE